jgi:hypothetical protein
MCKRAPDFALLCGIGRGFDVTWEGDGVARPRGVPLHDTRLLDGALVRGNPRGLWGERRPGVGGCYEGGRSKLV